MFSLEDLSAASILVLGSGPSWKSRGEEEHSLIIEPRLRSLATLKVGAPLPLQTCVYLQQLLPSEPACNLPFCHFQQNTALLPKRFKSRCTIIIPQQLQSYLILQSKSNLYLSLVSIFYNIEYFYETKIISEKHISIFICTFLVVSYYLGSDVIYSLLK